ncbi:MAG: hypothetical protein WBF35_13485 [Candidatus Acidiferrales bacterium]
MRELRSGESAIRASLRVVKEHYGRIGAISAAVLAPCYWHARIEAGDLASHVYNTWLGQLIEKGQAPGLYIARQWYNALFDVTLLKLTNVIGLGWAEKVAVSACVLIFFWGAFALIGAAARRAPWFLSPGIAMVAYGWTFHVGFMNYYVSLGFAFAAAALFWRGRKTDWIAGVLLALFSLLAHPLGAIWLAGIVAYVKAAESVRGVWRWLLPLAAMLALAVARVFVVHHFEAGHAITSHFYFFTGADQIALFSIRYVWLAGVMSVLGLATVVFGLLAGTESRWAIRVPLELWVVSVFAAAILPNEVYLRFYAAPVSLLAPRLTSTTAVLVLCIVACIEPRRRHFAGLAICSAIFFAWVYQDTGTLNRMEAQASQLVDHLPAGQRVTASIWFPLPAGGAGGYPSGPLKDYFTGISSVEHIVDRACIYHCFAYSDYEPASRQFRIRVSEKNAIVTNSPDDSSLMGTGRYLVRPEDLPMAQVCQCDEADRTKLCLRELRAGQLNGEGCYRPPSQ